MAEMRTTATVEEYLEAIFNMTSEKRPVMAARLAERLQVSRPTVTATLKRMNRDGLVATDAQKRIILTGKGMEMATSIVRRHRLAERLLTDILHVPWHEAHDEACLLEHGISDKVMERLYTALGNPGTCPHGNPIPVDNDFPVLTGESLDTIPEGATVVVVRITEEVSRLQELMNYFEQTGIKPGAVVTVKQVADYAGTISVLVGGKEHSLGIRAASLVWVVPAPAPG